MTSKTDVTRTIRRNKKLKKGAKRKADIRRNGTTPPLFSLNKPTQSEKDMANQLQ